MTEEIKPVETQVVETQSPAKTEDSSAELKRLQTENAQLRSENANRRVANRDLNTEVDNLNKSVAEIETLKAFVAATTPKLEALTKEAQDAKTAALIAEREAAAAKHGLPAEIAARLMGTTPAELEADAKALAALVKPASNPNEISVALGNVGIDPGPDRAKSLYDRNFGTGKKPS